jgi:hypothetical protein
MEKIKIIHDTIGQTLTVWFDDPAKEYICEETSEEVVLIKDSDGHVIGFELLHEKPMGSNLQNSVGNNLEFEYYNLFGQIDYEKSSIRKS